MKSTSNITAQFKKKYTLQNFIQQSSVRRQFHQILMCGVITGAALSSLDLHAATLIFESSRVAVTEPSSGSTFVSLRPVLTFGAYSENNADNIYIWDWVETTSSSCTVSGVIVPLQSNTTATYDEDYREADGIEFSLTTAPYFTEDESVRFDDVSQEILVEIMADEGVDEEGEEHIEFEFSDISISCGEGFAALTSESYGSTIVSITPESTPQPQGPQPIPQKQKSLSSQLNSIRSISLQTANTRNRSIAKEVNRARKSGGFHSNLQVRVNGEALPNSIVPGVGAGDTFESFGRWGFFVSGSIDIGKQKEEGSVSMDYDSSLLIAGIDYRATDNIVLGSAISYTVADSGSKAIAETDFNSSTLSLFASYYIQDAFYVDGIVSFGVNDYDLNRKIETDTSHFDSAAASTSGDETSLSLGAGYNLHDQNVNLRVFSLVNYIDANIDGYNETVVGSSSAAIVNDIDLQSLTTDLGLEASWNISADFGVYTPLVSVAWVHQFADNAVDINGEFIGGLDEGEFYFHAPDRDNDYVNAQIGISSVFKNGFNAYFTYDTDLGRKDLSSNHYTIGARWEF